MKTLFTALAITFSFMASAQAACIGEAQIIGKVATSRSIGDKCVVSLSGLAYHAANMMCPLDENEILNREIALQGDYSQAECAQLRGSEISGVVVVQDGELQLEL